MLTINPPTVTTPEVFQLIVEPEPKKPDPSAANLNRSLLELSYPLNELASNLIPVLADALVWITPEPILVRAFDVMFHPFVTDPIYPDVAFIVPVMSALVAIRFPFLLTRNEADPEEA